jgi:hypothetical protein
MQATSGVAEGQIIRAVRSMYLVDDNSSRSIFGVEVMIAG